LGKNNSRCPVCHPWEKVSKPTKKQLDKTAKLKKKVKKLVKGEGE